jgi:SRSO17 transposase
MKPPFPQPARIRSGSHGNPVARGGQVAHCPVAVRWHGSRAEASCPLHWWPYLPKAWFEDRERAAHVRVPPDTTSQRKTAVALAWIAHVLAWEVPALRLVADSLYGNDFGCRPHLRRRQVPSIVEVEGRTRVWTEDPNRPLPPPKKTGRPRRYPPWEARPRPRRLKPVAQQWPASAWTRVTWRQGSQGPPRSRFRVIQVWAAQGWREPPQPPRMAEWLLVERPQGEPAPITCWFAHVDSQVPGVRPWVRRATSRWRIAVDDRERKEELGVDHAEGRHWWGWPHHVCWVTLASALLRAEQARVKTNVWCDLAPGAEAPASLADAADRLLPLGPIPVRRLVLIT